MKVSIGIDIGSVATKGVVIGEDKMIHQKIMIPTGWSPKESSKNVYTELLKWIDKDGLEPVAKVVTGYGRTVADYGDKAVTEITCHGKGAHFLNPRARTVIDIGGQDSKVIHLNDKGRVLDFLMNDKCAAGTGKFLEVMATSLGVEVGQLSCLADGANPKRINQMCTVFAESEIISLLAEGAEKSDVAAGILESTAKKASVLLKRLGMKEQVFLTGGVSKSSMFRTVLEKDIGRAIYYNEDAQFAGAIGAAVVGLSI